MYESVARRTALNPVFSRRNLALVILVFGVAASVSLISYEYSISTAKRIEEISVHDIQSNAEIQAHDLANSLSNKLGDTLNTLEIIAGAPAIKQADIERAKSLLDRAQESNAELVEFYMWLDQDGRMVWLSNIDDSTYEQYKGIDLSYRLYFSTPKENHEVYYSSVVESNDQINRLYISYPVLRSTNVPESPDSREQFSGVIVAGIRTEILGQFLENQLSPNLQSEVGLLDNTGIILYSEQTEYIGKNAFGVRFQSFLTSIDAALLRTMNKGLKDAVVGNSGSEDVTMASGDSSTLVYKPIILEGKQFGVLYILAPHSHASDVTALIEQQKNLFVATIIVVAGAAAAAISIIFMWNKKLEEIVKTRTSELLKANEQLEAHDKLQKEFINIAAHELRTPVQPLIGVAEILANQFSASKKEKLLITRPEVDMIMRNAKRLLNLSSGILEVSRIESNTLKLNKESIDLKEKIETVVSDMQTVIPEGRNVKLHVENRIKAEEEPILVNADRERMFEVISNLLSNAIKFTHEGQVVVIIEKQGDDDFVVVSIKDSGKGLDSEILPRLFTKFATNSEMGTGLGLFIAKSIIEAHGGKIWAKNNDDRGATFSFSLPLAKTARAE